MAHHEDNKGIIIARISFNTVRLSHGVNLTVTIEVVLKFFPLFIAASSAMATKQLFKRYDKYLFKVGVANRYRLINDIFGR